jgi:hypothetical protein
MIGSAPDRHGAAGTSRMMTLPRNMLLMTATIAPENSPELARTDPAQRLHDYEQALDFYLTLLGDSVHGIIFVENSDSDISSLRALVLRRNAADQVEFLANYGRHCFPGRDRSYGEFKLLDHAMVNSRLIAAEADVIVWKVTGRYQVRNLLKVIRTAPKHFDIYCDLRSHPIPWMDLRLMAWTRAGYATVFEGVADRLGVDPREPVMRRYLPQRAGDARIVPSFHIEPLIEGHRGWDNRPYSRGIGRLKYCARVIARMIMPRRVLKEADQAPDA